ELAERAASGPWLEAAGSSAASDRSVDVAFVPFRLGPTREPTGCLAFALRPGRPPGPLSHRLRELIDATDYIVVVLRPAIELAETADSAISRIRELIADQRFSIHLQPIVRLQGGDVVAVEALSRFDDKVAPGAQFAEAAAYGLGGTLQRAAVAAAIEAVRPYPPDVAVSLNLSAD